MALEQLTLDNLAWTEMVTAIRRRIPAASEGEWTLHAPVDPGVTLLELFAYLLEQRVYWLDQIPDSLVHAALALMGATVRPATAAATVIRFAPRPFEKLNALTELRLARSVPPLVFSTDHEIWVLPVDEFEPHRDRIGLWTGKTNRSLDLMHGRRIPALDIATAAADVKVVLWLTAELPVAPQDTFGDFISLFVELETSQKTPPQWSAAAVADVPAAAKLSWLFHDKTTNKLEQFPEQAVEDGTGGLRRSGIVRLRVPANWQREVFDPALPNRWPYSLTLRIEDASFTSPPIIKRVMPNVVIGRHRRPTKEHSLKIEWLPLPGQALALSDLRTPTPPGSALPALQDHPALEETVQVAISERDDRFDWQPTQTLTFHGPDERVFIVDREKGLLRFGNGLTGRVPVINRQHNPNLWVKYFVGGGEAGNIGSNLDFEAIADLSVTARNVVTAQDGAEPESLDSARRRAAFGLRRVERAITGPDHERVVLDTPGVAFSRAYAALGHHPLHPCRVVPGAITVYVVPEAPRADGHVDDPDYPFVPAPIPDEGALRAARAQVEKARLIGNEVFVEPAQYRCVSLAVELSGDPADPSELSDRIRAALRKFLDPLRGGSQHEGWPFGEPLRPSVLLSEAQRAAGLDASVTSVAIGLDCNEPTENCKDVEIEPHQLVVLQDAVVHLQPEASSQGGLR